MELYATGFNAWSQLTFGLSPADEEPDDVFTFTKILAASSLGRIASEMSYTAGRSSLFLSPGLILTL
jgi:hypothetical protein